MGTKIRKPAANSAIGGFGLLLIGLAVPEMIEGAPQWVAHSIFGLGVVCLIAAGLLHFFQKEPEEKAVDCLSLQRYSLFLIQIDEKTLQVGAVVKLYNRGAGSFFIDAVGLEGADWTLLTRGGFVLKRIFGYMKKQALLGDCYIKPHSEAYFKVKTPIKFEMRVLYEPAPELIIRERSILKVRESTDPVILLPDQYAVYERSITCAEWDNILGTTSSVHVDDLIYKAIPERPLANAPYKYYLMYNRDRTAIIDDYYIGHTPLVKGDRGVLTFISCKTEPRLSVGWASLGQTYHEVWSDPEKLELYNSIYPPDDDGSARPIGYFAGSENEMAGPIHPPAGPATVSADILDIIGGLDDGKYIEFGKPL